MKRNTVLIFFALCAAIGAARFLDLCFYTDPATGFAVVGSVWLRYGALLLPVVGVLLASALEAHGPQKAFAAAWKALQPVTNKAANVPAAHSNAVSQDLPPAAEDGAPKSVSPVAPAEAPDALFLPSLPVPQRWCCALLTFAAALAGVAAFQYAISEFAVPTTSFGTPEGGSTLQLVVFWMRMLVSISLLCLGVWFALLTGRAKPLAPERTITRTIGLFSCIALFLLPVLRYAEHPSTLYRTLTVLPVFSALAALWFLVQFVGALCTPHTPRMRAKLSASGLLAFFLCTCIELPQTFWQMSTHGVTLFALSISALLGILGLLGALTALTAARGSGEAVAFPTNNPSA